MNIDDFLAAPKPRAKPRRLEDDLHLRVAKYLRAVIGHEQKTSTKGVLWRSIEQRGRKSVREGAANKARGAAAGTEDIQIIYKGQLHAIELKSMDGRLSDTQQDLHGEYDYCGVHVAVCRSVDEIRSILFSWNIPTQEAV